MNMATTSDWESAHKADRNAEHTQYLMIRDLSVSRFKSFERLEMEGLRQINILVGKSASGKTTLLEAIRLGLAGTPNQAYSLSAMRGMLMPFLSPPSRAGFESLWSPMFYNFETDDHQIRFEIVDNRGRQASVQIGFNYSDQIQFSLPQPPAPLQQLVPEIIYPITFYRRAFDQSESTSYGTLNQQGNLLFAGASDELGIATDFYPSTWQSNAIQVANWFSNLSIFNKERDIVKSVVAMFDNVVDLSVQSPSSFPVLHATIDGVPRKIPLSFVSSGINKIVSILISIKTFAGGVVLIDEIENGVYYKLFPDFWRVLTDFASESETQIFVSTHSLECLRGALPTIDKKPSGFNLLQVHQSVSGSEIAVVPGDRAAAAIEADIEVRR